MPLVPDLTYYADGLLIKEYLLTKHNPNKIDMPTSSLPSIPRGVTVHNTDSINVASNTTPAEQYTRATANGNMSTVRVHFYVDESCAWQNLPLTLSGWHAADGNGDGNRKTIAIEIIGNSTKAEENGAKLVAWLLKKYNLDIDHLFTHTYWLNVRDGKKGTIDQLNVMKHSYKTCPSYIIPHWQTFKQNVNNKIGNIVPPPETSKQDSVDSDGTNITNAPEQIQIIDNKINTINDSIIENEGVAAQSEVNIFYQVYSNKKWWPEVKNIEDYAGVKGYPISCIAARASQGKLSYRVHQIGSYWMKWIDKCDIDHVDGYAGIGGIKIDAIQVKLEELPGFNVRYRVAAVGKDYYPWVIGANDNNFAGVQGQKIDRIQIEIVKEKQ